MGGGVVTGRKVLEPVAEAEQPARPNPETANVDCNMFRRDIGRARSLADDKQAFCVEFERVAIVADPLC
jgi:hypothetical protein